jgi:hypothetical protein
MLRGSPVIPVRARARNAYNQQTPQHPSAPFQSQVGETGLAGAIELFGKAASGQRFRESFLAPSLQVPFLRPGFPAREKLFCAGKSKRTAVCGAS